MKVDGSDIHKQTNNEYKYWNFSEWSVADPPFQKKIRSVCELPASILPTIKNSLRVNVIQYELENK